MIDRPAPRNNVTGTVIDRPAPVDLITSLALSPPVTLLGMVHQSYLYPVQSQDNAMNIEMIGTPVTSTSGNAASEKVKVLVTRDDGTTDVAETRAICMRVGDLTIEALMTITEGKTSFGLMTFQTVSVLPNGEVGKVVNRAVQDDDGNLYAVADEPMCVREQEFSTTQVLLNFIAQQVQAAQTQQSGTSP